MNDRKWKTLTILGAAFISHGALADLPLTIEDLLTAEGRYRVEAGIVFANSDRRSSTSSLQTIQIGTGQFVQIPISLGDTRRNTDIVVATLGFRYGLSLETELYSRLTGINSTTRIDSVTGTRTESDHALGDWSIGINHRFSNDNETPALIGFLEGIVVENTVTDGTNYVNGKTWHAGLTTYRTIDPIVLSLTSGYRYSLARNVEGRKTDPGDIFYFNPNIGFAVNQEVTLSGGLQIRWHTRDRSDGRAQTIDTAQTRLEFGMGYAWNKRLTIHTNVRTDISGDEGAEASINLIWKFDDKLNLGSSIEEGSDGAPPNP